MSKPRLRTLLHPFLRHPPRRPYSMRPTTSITTTEHTLLGPPSRLGGPMMERQPNRALPKVIPDWHFWAKTLPPFIALMTVSALGIFNYEKQSSSVVAATLYSLRTSEAGRRELGDEIYFRDAWPWIWGKMNTLRGVVDIEFGVKGTRATGWMRFRSERHGRQALFKTTEWTLETEDGRKLDLMEEERQSELRNKLPEEEEF